MADYAAWNRAIIAYVTAGAAKGSPIFLSVDSEAIEEVAARFLDEPVAGDPLLDFVGAVCHRCVASYCGSVDISGLRRKNGDVPGGVGFLGLLVYAAYNMQEEEGIDESNYFLRLREVLGLPPYQHGRPEGLRPGAEEPLWRAWNRYLTDAGFQETAERGAGPQTYLRYVFSQAILRESDKQYLRQRFHDGHLPLQFDCDQLGFWLSRQSVNRRHLSDGLHHPDPGRVWEFYRATHRVYEAGDWVVDPTARPRAERSRLRSIECGLYRAEDILGEPHYWLFPKQPVRTRSSQLTVTPPHGASDQPLRPFRAGFFAPLWPQVPFVDEAVLCPVVGDPGVQALLFPKREFWILTLDPENPLGAWATWRPYLELGERLLVLCREGPFDAEMARFKAAKLLDWTARRTEGEGWVEYHGCMILSYDWGGFIATPECRALADALAPRAMAGVSLIGGLRDPNQNAWLEGFAPTVKVYGFERQFELTVTSAHGLIYKEEIPRQHEVALADDLEPDTYQIEVKFGGKRVAVRMLRVVPWANIQEHPEPEKITNSSPASTAGILLRGARIVPNAGDSKEVAHA